MKNERLIQESSVSGRALAAFDARTADPRTGSEERTWRMLQTRLTAPSSRASWIGAAAALAAGAAVAVAIVSLRTPRPPTPVPASAPTTVAPPPLAVVPSARPVAPPPSLLLPPRLRRLPGGSVRLAAGTVVSVGERTRAQGRQRAGATQLVLDSGTLKLDLTADPRDAGVSVQAGPYRFVDLGTVFRVTREGGRVRLWVEAGKVAVWRGDRLVATVDAGGQWSSSRAAIPVVSGPTAPADPVRACAAMLADASAADAVACYGRLADGESLIAETALYQEARLLAQRLSDLPAALARLREHRRRFPRGALRAEVDLTLVELLPRLGRFQEALDESTALLSREPRHERAAELHLLRGNILRESFQDYRRAEVEYAAVAAVARPDGSGAVADDAAFFQAACLEVVGRDQAADAYRRYLARPAPRHAVEARARLSALVR